MASLLRRGFQFAHSCEPSVRIVGRSNDRERWLSVCASSTQAILKPSRLLIDSAVASTLEDDEAVTGRDDAIVQYLELTANTELLYLRLNQPL
jgi:hypothetical protein